MIVVGVREANDHVHRLIERACAGEEVVITRRGKAVARLKPISPQDAEAMAKDNLSGGWAGGMRTVA